jgi:hypothetical protein
MVALVLDMYAMRKKAATAMAVDAAHKVRVAENTTRPAPLAAANPTTQRPESSREPATHRAPPVAPTPTAVNSNPFSAGPPPRTRTAKAGITTIHAKPKVPTAASNSSSARKAGCWRT